MDKVTLVVQKRDVTGTRNAKRMRKAGLIPGVLYGHGKEATVISVDPHALRQALTTGGNNAVFEVTFEGQKRTHHAIVKELELDRVKSTVAHIDLQEIRLDETIETTVAVIFEGASAGVKAGGMLDESTREVTVRGLVTAIPQSFVIDISALEINDTAKVSDLVAPEGIEILEDADMVICSVLPPRTLEEEEVVVEEGAEGAEEPELVGKTDQEETAD